jgi:hypothetical protein
MLTLRIEKTVAFTFCKTRNLFPMIISKASSHENTPWRWRFFSSQRYQYLPFISYTWKVKKRAAQQPTSPKSETLGGRQLQTTPGVKMKKIGETSTFFLSQIKSFELLNLSKKTKNYTQPWLGAWKNFLSTLFRHWQLTFKNVQKLQLHLGICTSTT